MKILLFNDNPVVRKLVALSAQKTKDDLSVVWSVEEVEESGYDLLIIDDGLYSDETFGLLKGTATFKTTLLMATRGNAVPAGFDHVINKPFLPTDLVDIFVRINADLASKATNTAEGSFSKEESYAAINLDDSFLNLDPIVDDEFSFDDLGGLSDALPVFDEEEKLPAVLDREEVQEVRDLLEDTDKEESHEDEELSVGSDDSDKLDTPQEQVMADDMESFDFEGLDFDDAEEADTLNAPDEVSDLISDKSVDETVSDTMESFDFEGLDFDDEVEEAPSLISAEAIDETILDNMDLEDDIDSEDDSLLMDEELLENDLVVSDDKPLSDEAFDDLELKIEEAVGGLEPDDLDMEFDESVLEGLDLEESEESEPVSLPEGLEGFEELDMLNERDLKLAIGEEVEDEEPEIHVGESEHASLNVEALSEAIDLSSQPSIESNEVTKATSTEGVEALQALLKALSNEDVAKSLKGLNISININFGNDK